MTTAAAPIVYIDRSEIRVGRLGELEQAIDTLVDHIAANEPRLLGYDVFFSEDRSTMTVIHSHPDSASLEHHLRVVAPLLAPFNHLIRLRAIDVYGNPSQEVLEQLRHKATLLGGATVRFHEHRAGAITRDARPRWSPPCRAAPASGRRTPPR